MEVQEYVDLKLVHEIHTSERRSFRACRRRWDWLFRQSYYPLTTAKPLEFGSAYHAAMEVYYEPSTWQMDREIVEALAIKTFVDYCEKNRANALKVRDQIDLEPEIQQDYNERVALGRGMLSYYFKDVAPYEDRGWKPKKVEISFMLPIPNPETGEQIIWCKCALCYQKALKAFQSDHNPFPSSAFEGLPVVYAGRLDMLAEDDDGNYWIFDWKTCRNVSVDDEFLYLDDQIGSYVWALRQLGFNVRGFVYHEQRKGFPQPPKQNANRRLGCLFSVAKNQDVDYDTYLKHITEFDPVALGEGRYDTFLEYLKEDGSVVYFKRHQIHKSQEEIASIQYNIGLEALDMIDEHIRLYPSAGRFGCGFCAFRQPCMEKNSQGDYQYALDTMFEKKQHYYIRNEPSTESKGGE